MNIKTDREKLKELLETCEYAEEMHANPTVALYVIKEKLKKHLEEPKNEEEQ